MNFHADGDTIKQTFPGVCRISGEELMIGPQRWELSGTARNWRRPGRRDSSLPASIIIQLPSVTADFSPALKLSCHVYKPGCIHSWKAKERFKASTIPTFQSHLNTPLCSHLYLSTFVHLSFISCHCRSVLLSVGRKQLLENESLCQSDWTNISDPQSRKYSLWEKSTSRASSV